MKKLEKNISKPVGPPNEPLKKPLLNKLKKITLVADATQPPLPPPARDVRGRPTPPAKRIIREDIKINPFLQGFIWAFLIIILMHIGLAYMLL